VSEGWRQVYKVIATVILYDDDRGMAVMQLTLDKDFSLFYKIPLRIVCEID
jgi:hypothetical protein